MKRHFLPLFAFALHLSIIASPVVQEVTVYPFAATITQQSDLCIEEYVPLDAKRPGKKWTFKNPNVSRRTVWRVTAESNTVFNAWLDTDGNGKYDIGEPFGTSAGRDYPEIELSNFSPITPRIDLVSQKSDRGLAPSDILQSIRDYIDRTYGDRDPQLYSNMLNQIAWIKGNLFEQTGLMGDSPISQRIRIVRWLVNGVPSYRGNFLPKVILDKKISTDVRQFLTEADILVCDRGDSDLDWKDLRTDIVDDFVAVASCGDVTNASYMVVVGDGPNTWTTSPQTNYVVKALGTAITRIFGTDRLKPIPRSPIVRGSSVTLRWMMDAPDIEGYTAYRAKILSGETEVHDTGLVRNPARWQDRSFHWTVTNAIPPGTYSWKIAAYNSKFSNEQDSAYTNGVPFTVTGD